MNPEELIQLESRIAEPANSLNKIDALNSLALEIRNTDTHRSISLSQEAFKLSELLGYRGGKANSLSNEAFCYVQVTNYDLALEKLLLAREIFEDLKDSPGIARVHYNLCILYFRLGDFNNALEGINKAILHYQEENNTSELARCYFQMGLLYHFLNDNISSIEYHNHAIELSRKSGLKAVEAASKMGLGQVYLATKDYGKSKEYLSESLEIRNAIGDQRGYAAALNAYMTLCIERGSYDEAEKISIEGIELANTLGDRMGVARFTVDLAKIYHRKKNMALAQEKAMEALSLAEKINLKMAIAPAHLLLSEIYEEAADFSSALHHYQVHVKINGEINDNNAAMKAKSMQFLNRIENAQKEAEINRLKNVELKRAFEEIEEKNREITASITYALRIQTAILPPHKIVKQYLEDSFILYKPKDIVAGDFYWMETVGDIVLFAACDCTGHGVPGAMVSVVCHNALNRAVREFGLVQPGAILDKTAEIVKDNFNKSEEDIKDGMDISLCAFNYKKRTLEWAGANNPLWLIQDGELVEIKANKQPIGMHEDYVAFTNHQFDLDAGDSIYIFSDGYADQFGGESGQKKLTKKGFKNLLMSLLEMPMADQCLALDKFHTDYRKGVEQIDDILVIGARVQ